MKLVTLLSLAVATTTVAAEKESKKPLGLITAMRKLKMNHGLRGHFHKAAREVERELVTFSDLLSLTGSSTSDEAAVVEPRSGAPASRSRPESRLRSAACAA